MLSKSKTKNKVSSKSKTKNKVSLKSKTKQLIKAKAAIKVTADTSNSYRFIKKTFLRIYGG